MLLHTSLLYGVIFGTTFEPFFANLAIVGIVVLALLIIFQVLRLWFRQFTSDLPLVTLTVSRIPLIAIATAIGLKLSLATLPASTALTWLQHGLSAVVVIFATYWFAQLFTRVTSYYLKQYAERSEAMWDDVLIPILENTLPVLIYLFGGLLVLQTLGLDLTGLLVAIGGAAFILGFALKDILANFFSGLVLLIDTPFRFGDVILLPDNTRAVIKHIGLRVTNLYLIDTHSEVYIPNATLEGQNIINLSRPTNHYYYSINIPIRADVDPARAIRLMEDVILAHPDTIGDVDQKLQCLDRYYGSSVPDLKGQQKRESGRKRLLAEQQVSKHLAKIEDTFAELSDRVARLEKGGLDPDEVRTIQRDYLKVCELIGLEIAGGSFGVAQGAERHEKQKRVTKSSTSRFAWRSSVGSRLVEIGGDASENTLIGLIRQWYRYWLDDPDLIKDDRSTLPREWEQKIGLLKLKLSKLFVLVSQPSGFETRLDDQIEAFQNWMVNSFKSSRSEWQDPKIWINEVTNDYTRETTVKFYVDNIKLEHCERGNRVKSEVYREIIWHLRQAYLCN